MINNPTVLYRGNLWRPQSALDRVPRDETNRTLLVLPRNGAALFHFGFLDASPSNTITPRFLLSDGELLLEGTQVDAADGHQLYLIGHGQVIHRGVVGHITGQSVGEGAGTARTFDLEIELSDPLLSEGIAGNTTFRPSHLLLEMVHGGPDLITYGATILVGT
jgi:hypothetical protein